jgi:hypothetical protein
MQLPSYKPDQWVVYEQGQTGGFGRILGASFNGESWVYSLRGPIVDTTYAEVYEPEITHFYENGSWLEAKHGNIGGKTSAYTD